MIGVGAEGGGGDGRMEARPARPRSEEGESDGQRPGGVSCHGATPFRAAPRPRRGRG